ncbi:histidine kinase [Aquimarina sp. ERC-38]|uniref:sensor histidine kinase n=1 Tax=Aquimarina sp. ERC-38 TaxID=2949996 RepID=UPI002247186C|nr:histidine kinase [Aquimarina sp. ERC-38]UZO80546.1 histidine kinase [Aquimarina sp. ERC-38]
MNIFRLLLLSVIIGFKVTAQHPVYYQFTDKDGLPDYELYDMIIDQKGFIWLAANNGLYRYDGNEFKNYTNKSKTGLSVFGLQEDSNGKIWCNNLYGQLFYVEGDSLRTFINVNKYTGSQQLQDFKVLKDHVFVTSDNGLIKINQSTKHLSILKSKNCNSVKCKTGATRIVDSNVWYIESGIDKDIVRYHTNNDSQSLYDQQNIANIYNTSNGIFFNTNNNLFRTNLTFWEPSSKQLIAIKNVPKSIENSRTVYIYNDHQNYYWLCGTAGVIRFKLVDHTMTEIKTYFPNKFISRVLQDQQDRYWFSTVQSGMLVVPDLEMISYNIKNSTIGLNSIRTIAADTIRKDLYYASTNKVLGKLSKKDNQCYLQYNPRMRLETMPLTSLQFSYQENAAIMVGTNVVRWDQHNVTNFNGLQWKDFCYLPNNSILYSSIYTSGIMHNFFQNTLYKKLNYVGDKKVNKKETIKELRPKRSYTTHHNSRTGISYIGYVDDLYIYKDTIDSYPVRFRGNPIFSTDITETTDGTVWVSSFNFGLLGFTGDVITERYTKSSGLLSNEIIKLKADHNHIWVVTNKGVQCLKRTNKKVYNIITIDKNDGLPVSRISDIELLEDKVYIATQKGLFSFYKDKEYYNAKAPDIYISEIRINDLVTNMAENLAMYYNQDVTFYFNANAFNLPPTTKAYKYRLRGLEEQWKTTHTNQARYSSIPGGSYTFEVKSINEDKVESTTIAVFPLEVIPPFWYTWWFYMLISFILLSIIILVFSLRLQQVQKQNELVRQKKSMEIDLINSKLVALRAQMNPHFIFNALNSIQEYIITNQKGLASDYLGKFADLMRIYLNHSQLNEITLAEEIKALTLYLELEKNRFEDSLQFKIDCQALNLSTYSIKIPSLLIQPYVENAIKHGLLHKKTNRSLKIIFSSPIDQEKLIHCTIEDNGIGRIKSKKINQNRPKHYKSFASNAGKTRLALLNRTNDQQIGVKINDILSNGQVLGTRVILKIPYTKN